MPNTKKISAAWLLAGTAFLFSGCATPPDLDAKPGMGVASDYASGRSFAATERAWPADDWWSAYGDPQLDALIAEALADSPSLAAASARVRRAQAAVEQSGAALKPSVGVKATAAGAWHHLDASPPAALEGVLGQDTAFRTSATAQLDYQLDFFGRNRSALVAATSRAQAERAEAASARLQLSTAVALTYADFVRLCADKAASEDAVRVRRESGALVAQRLKAGLENEGQAGQAESELAKARADLDGVETAIARARTALAALLGKGPDRGLSIAEPKVPALPVLGLPATAGLDLMGRRPDLTAARLRAEAAADRIAVARADFYPNVSLSASAGVQTLGLDALGGGVLGLAQLGPAVSLPIFSGGRLEGAYRGVRADYDEAVALYNQALVRALGEVADAVGDRRGLETRLDHSRAALDAAENAHRIIRLRYGRGLASYIDVLAIEGGLVAQRRAVADLQAQAFSLDVTLVRALGGGFAAS